MIKIVIATHMGLSRAYLETARLILGQIDNVESVEIDINTSLDFLKDVVKNTLDSVSGTIILTDMFGGTPSNLSIPYAKEGNVEVIFGLNLPMLITAITKRNKLSLIELAKEIVKSGKESIFRALEI